LIKTCVTQLLPTNVGKMFQGAVNTEPHIKNPAVFFAQSAYDKFVKSTGKVGRADGQWVTELKDVANISDRQSLAKKLGLPAQTFPEGEAVIMAKYTEPKAHPQAVPTSTTQGANADFVPGGFTKGGAKEALLPRVPVGTTYMPSDQGGLTTFQNVTFEVVIPSAK